MKISFDIFSISPISNEVFAKVSDQQNCKTTVIAFEEKNDGTFKFHYEVGVNASHPFTFRERVDFTKAVAALSGTEILIPDEDINPYLFIYLRPNEEAFTVLVETGAYDDSDELTIDSFYSLGWGMFALEKPLTSEDEELISQKFGHILPDLKLVQIDSGLINPDFRAAQENFSTLKIFANYYFLSLPDESVWYSKEEKSKLAVEFLYYFHVKSKHPVCIFPVNHSIIENIPGGSDSEQFCILLENGNQRKVIYKERRKSW